MTILEKAGSDLDSAGRTIAVVAFFLLFLGIGRLFAFVLHEPMLGYANSYDMIRLQACHQIWPADKGIDITQGTPSAPLRRYTLDKHLDTPCFPSSELVFTGTGIAIAKLKNAISGQKLVSMKTIGFTKAVFLALTALVASLYFYRRQWWQALLANGLVMAVVLSDPGITLYLNTFYTEFSALYFLYLALLGLVVTGKAPRHWLCCLPLLVGLLGLGLSKPQHLPLAWLLGLLAAGWLWRCKLRSYAAIAMLCGALPLAIQASGYWQPRDDGLATFRHANILSAILSAGAESHDTLYGLSLPDSCAALNSTRWFVSEPDPAAICPGINTLSAAKLYGSLVAHPSTALTVLSNSLPVTKEWIFNGYGQVEGASKQLASTYQWTLFMLLQDIPILLFSTLLLLIPALLALAVLVRRQTVGAPAIYALLLASLGWLVLPLALMHSGFYNLSVQVHLCVPLMLAALLVMAAEPVQYMATTATGARKGNHHA